MDTQTKNILKLLILPLMLVAALVNYYAQASQPDYLMHLDFLDIGQGDSILITTYRGNQVLIDGGPGDAVMEQLGKRIPIYDRTIDLVMLTHAHADHFEGLISVLEGYDVKRIMLPDIDYSASAYNGFKAAMEDEGAEITYAVQGQRIWLDDATVFDVLSPKFTETFTVPKKYDLNDSSIVGMLIFGRTRVLFTGDAGFEQEAELLPGFDLNADLLKVGHHGSKTSTSREFLAEVTPEFAVIQLGKNKYGHPSPEALARLAEIGALVFRTDESPDLEFTSDGSKIHLQNR
jgi:competence protein ComEC